MSRRPRVPSSPAAAPARPPRLVFRAPADHLEACFDWMDLAAAGAAPAVLEARAARISAATRAAVRRGVPLPFVALAASAGLDATDRLVLLQLLRAAIERPKAGGLVFSQLARGAGATSLAERLALRDRLEESGALRDLRALECDANLDLEERLYRLAPALVDLLSRGPAARPAERPPATADEALTRVIGAARVVSLVRQLDDGTGAAWATAVPGEPGWDVLGGARADLVRLLAALRSKAEEPVGRTLAEAKLDDAEAVVLALLAERATEGPAVLAAPALLESAVPAGAKGVDPEALLGARGRLVKGGLVRLSDGAASLPFRSVSLTRAARERLRLPSEGDASPGPRPIGFSRPRKPSAAASRPRGAAT